MMPLLAAVAVGFLVATKRLTGLLVRARARKHWRHYYRTKCDRCERLAARTLALAPTSKLRRPRVCSYHARKSVMHLGSPGLLRVLEASREYYGTANHPGYYDARIAARFSQRRAPWQKRLS